MRSYNGVGTIKQIPATKRNYRGKNKNGGRKIPSSTIGAAVRNTLSPRWERGIEDFGDIRVMFVIGNGSFVIKPYKGR